MNADTHQLDEVARSWPPALRDAFFAAYQLLANADWIHFGLLGKAEPRHALRWVLQFAALERLCRAERRPVAVVERYLMTARDNQPFRWGDESFTCAHRAVLTLATRVAHLVVRAVPSDAIHIPDVPDTGGERAWRAAYFKWGQACGLLDGKGQAGERWHAFPGRYRERASEVVWDYRAADELQTALLLEANGAAPLVPREPPGGGSVRMPDKGSPQQAPNGHDRDHEGAAPGDPLPQFPALDPRLYAIHYSQELHENSAAQTPPVSAVVVQHVLTGQQHTFAAFRVAEQRGIGPAHLPAHLPELEKQLLADFFDFVARNPDAVWLHWAMRQPRFGFEVLAQRARLHGLTLADLSLQQRFDLSSYLKRRFGDDYVPHPRFLNALQRNGLLGPEFLTEAAAAEAWAKGEYARLLASLSCKVDAIADLFDRVRLGTFQSGPIEPLPPEGEIPSDRQGKPGKLAAEPQGALPQWVGEHFQRYQHVLLCLLWGRGEVPIPEVTRAIYKGATNKEEALDKVKDRVNAKLAEINQPYEVATRRGQVYILRQML